MIIAELCQNHLGKPDLLREMVAKAAEAGCAYAKIQTFFADDLSPEWRHEYDRLKSLELDWDTHAKFVQWCKEFQITPMTSVYTLDYAQQLHEAGFKYIKIGSAQACNEDLIRTYIGLGFKVLLSTGGHKILDIPKVGPLTGIFHCVSKYPHMPEEANLLRMLEFRKWYGMGTPLGFSDHTDPLDPGWYQPSKLALFMGATFIERHFTILDRDQTKDGKVSVDFEQLKELNRWDRLAQTERLEEVGELGMLSYPQSQDELDLIARYEKRWKQVI